MQLIYEDMLMKSFMTFHSQQTIIAQNGGEILTSEKKNAFYYDNLITCIT